MMSPYTRIEDGEDFQDGEDVHTSEVNQSVGKSKVLIATGILSIIFVAVSCLASNATTRGTILSFVNANPDSSDEQNVWMQRSDVREYMGLKKVYGDMSEDDIHGLFRKFKDDFKRIYADDNEESDRFVIFKKNLKFIDALNRQNPIALFGITDSTDKTVEERSKRRMSSEWSDYDVFKSTLPTELVKAAEKGPEFVSGKTFDSRNPDTVGGEKLKAGQVRWGGVDDCAACAMYPDFSDYNYTNHPTDFDWRDLGAVSGVKNQKYCGSCYSFSTAQNIEGVHFLATGNLTTFSEQQIVACDFLNDGCDGGYMYRAMQYIADFGGLVSEDAYPYKAVMMDYKLGTPHCDTDLLNEKLEGDGSNIGHISSYQWVAMGAEFENLMKIFLLKNGPLALAVNANGMDYYVHGITGCKTIAGWEYCDAGAIDTTTPCDPTELDHGVLAVGYGNQEGSEYWVIKNSWGPQWGEDGYYRLERGTDHCGVANMVTHGVYKPA